MMNIRKKTILFLCFVMVLRICTSCTISKVRKRPIPTARPAAVENIKTGVVTENDGIGQITLRNLDSEKISTFYYDDTSEIQDEYGQERDGEKIEQGEILEVTYDSDEDKILTAAVPKNVWYYHEVQKFSFDTEQNMLEFVGEKYQYTSQTFFSDGTDEIQPMDFDSKDMLTIRGIGVHVYSVVRTSGHGYVRVTNYKDFMGGLAELDNGMMVLIGENLMMTVPEGTHRLTLVTKNMSATKTVVVMNGQETVADFSDYKREIKDIGEVIFDIRPEGAELTLNETSINYSKPVTLSYGKYKVKVTLAGYADYIGVLNVEQASKTIHIELEEADAEVALPSPTPKKTEDNNTNNNVVTRKVDSKHTITVTEPIGVEVYLDNIYKGMTPCTFTKVLGSQTLTLSLPGYASKSYSVDILDDNQNVKLKFAELQDESENENTAATPTPTPASASADLSIGNAD